MKNRFYFSKTQWKERHRCFVTNDSSEEVEYTEWCSSPEACCHAEDAMLVYETDDECPKLRIEGPSLKEAYQEYIGPEPFLPYDQFLQMYLTDTPIFAKPLVVKVNLKEDKKDDM